MANFIVREGKREDCQEIIRLKQELAAYEKSPVVPKINVEDLQYDGFDIKPPLYQTYVAERVDKPGVLVGYAIYHYTYGSWTGRKMFLRDIFVTESYRKSGAGFALMRKLIEKCIETDCQELDFSVLDWNPAQKFYLRLGATDISESEGWRLFRIDKPEMLAVLS